jgi:hypothetical protein
MGRGESKRGAAGACTRSRAVVRAPAEPFCAAEPGGSATRVVRAPRCLCDIWCDHAELMLDPTHHVTVE